ncbi:MAG: glucosyl transferase, partial [Bacteroidetes bacterium]|nr:glucosyl transferase [Bacteroidota bacterium]
YRNNEYLTAFTMDKADTLFFDEGLLPSKTYNYKAKLGGFTAMAEAVTMDTTSHNFSWETFTFGGQGGSSALYDVAIIDENNIWAVGEIHTAETDRFDSNGVWVQPYNAVHWDGDEWELKKIYFYTFCNQNHKAPYPASAVFSFNNGIVAIASGSQITYLENGEQKNIECIPASVNAMWGTSSKDFYVVGNNGNIAHYDGSPSGTGWEKIESGTELNFYDIHGNYNYKTNKWEIIAVASHIAHSKERAIVKIENNKIESLSSEPIGWSLSSVWFIPNRKYYVVGSGIYKKNFLQNSAWNADLYNLTPYYASEILGNGLNDIFIVGACGIVFHFNGTTWREQQPVNCNHGYGNISMKDNIVAISGSNGSEGILLLGKR